jgi:hypothetical protein
MQEQLKYWQDESVAAHASGDVDRIRRCEHFVQQCEGVIVVLEDAIKADGSSRA